MSDLLPISSPEADYVFVSIEDSMGPGTGTYVLSAAGSGVPAVAASDILTRKWLALCGECTRLRLLHDQAVAAREEWRDRMGGVQRPREDVIHAKNRKLLLEKAMRLLEAKLKHIAAGGEL